MVRRKRLRRPATVQTTNKSTMSWKKAVMYGVDLDFQPLTLYELSTEAEA